MRSLILLCPHMADDMGTLFLALLVNYYYEPQRLKMYLRACTLSEDSNQPAHSRSLFRIFPMRILDSQGFKVSLCAQRRLKSACSTAQAGLSLRLAHMLKYTFSYVPAIMIIVQQNCFTVNSRYLEVFGTLKYFEVSVPRHVRFAE